MNQKEKEVLDADASYKAGYEAGYNMRKDEGDKTKETPIIVHRNFESEENLPFWMLFPFLPFVFDDSSSEK